MSFLSDDFLLSTSVAQNLFHSCAKGRPIVDFHNHLCAREIAEDVRFDNLAQVWLGADHYKWRAMRSNGIDESLCTGNGQWNDKFTAWVNTLAQAQGNPLYLWAHLELKRYFGIETLLTPETAVDIYQHTSSLLQAPDFSARNLLRKMNVSVLCTTDDPCDDLRYHTVLRESDFEIRVLPTFRPDKAFNITAPLLYQEWLQRLGSAANVAISSIDTLMEALVHRMDAFDAAGCRCADHSLEPPLFCDNARDLVGPVFKKASDGQPIDMRERSILQTAVLLELGREYHRRGWVWQLHAGALRNVRTRLHSAAGADAGGDIIDDAHIIRPLASLLNALDTVNSLPKTVLYNLNPRDNEALMALVGAFADGSSPGKISWGPAWWFMDQCSGMERHLNTLSQLGLLGQFIGMTTDSRSLLSFPRHELFRRVLCGWIGKQVTAGLFPDDEKMLDELVSSLCSINALSYFNY